MDETIKKLLMERRKKTRRFLFSFFLFSAVLLIISPLISLFASLLLAGAAAYGLSPTMNLYRGFKSSAMLSVVSKESAQEIYNNDTEEVSKRKSQYWDLVVIVLLSMGIFLLSLTLLSFGWNGIISYLL